MGSNDVRVWWARAKGLRLLLSQLSVSLTAQPQSSIGGLEGKSSATTLDPGFLSPLEAFRVVALYNRWGAGVSD
nr:hypothetical protein CFP56_09689 [Quercus suber]